MTAFHDETTTDDAELDGEELSEADASGRLDDVPGAQPELSESQLAPEGSPQARPPNPVDLATADIPEDT